VTQIHSGVLFGHKEWNYVTFRKMEGTGDHYVKQNKPDSERWVFHIFSHTQNTDLKKRHEYKKGTVGEGEPKESEEKI
jgi:hypothetical protein